MKKLFTILFSLISVVAVAQSSEIAKPYPDSVRQRIKSAVEKEGKLLISKLKLQDMTSAERQYAVDTFKIWRTNSLRQDYDFSTEGMNNSVMEMADAYDKLMNFYYNKLLKLLEPADRVTLTTSQKAWIKFRDAETKLISTMSDWKYNSGGTIQSNFATGRFIDLVQQRTDQLFSYYDAIIEKKEFEKQ